MSDTGRVGQLVAALADGVRADLEEIAVGLGEVRAMVERLGESARAINGLGGDCAGWSNHLDAIAGEVKKEMQEIPAKLLGTPINPIVSTVNADHVERVRKAKGEAA